MKMRLIKRRQVLQFVFEVPLEDLDAARTIAREDGPQSNGGDKRLAVQAGRACIDPVFWKFLSEHFHDTSVDNQTAAITFVRDYCAVESRSHITPGTDAAARWQELRSQFAGWKLI